MPSVPEDPAPAPAPPAPPGVPPMLAAPGQRPAKQQPTWLKKLLAPFVAAGTVLAKFLAQFKLFFFAILKFGLPILKTGGTMLLSVWVYAQMWGWRFAVGFVLLIFVHECGHLLVAKYFRLNVSAPMFIPFMGALILLKQTPRNAWMEAWVGIGGPLLGSLGALACALVYLAGGSPLFLALAYTGFFINLFNLAPISPLDGGRIVTALSPWLWIVGYAVMIAYAIWQPHLLLFIIIAAGLPRLLSLFRAKTPAQRRYFEVSTPQRVIMAAMYFGLIVLLAMGMELTHLQIN